MSRWYVLPVFAIALAACGGDDDTGSADESTATTSPETTTAETTPPETSTTVAAPAGGGTPTTTGPIPTTTDAAETTALPETTAAPETTAPPTTTAPSSDCLIGSWVISEDEMNAFYDTIESQSDAGFDIAIAGETRLDFTADTFRYTPAFTLTLDVAGQTGEGDTTGSVSGTWVDDGGLLTTTLTSSDLDVIVTVMGVTVNGSDMANGMLNSFPIVDSPYTCGPTPTIMFKTAEEGVRHPVTLTPA